MILAFCVAAREFASMGRRLFSRRLGDIGTRSRLQTLDGRPTSSASASSWMGATATAWPAGPYPLQADSSPWRTHALSAHVHLPKPLLVWDVRRMTDGAIVNVVATISYAGGSRGLRPSGKYTLQRQLHPQALARTWRHNGTLCRGASFDDRPAHAEDREQQLAIRN